MHSFIKKLVYSLFLASLAVAIPGYTTILGPSDTRRDIPRSSGVSGGFSTYYNYDGNYYNYDYGHRHHDRDHHRGHHGHHGHHDHHNGGHHSGHHGGHGHH